MCWRCIDTLSRSSNLAKLQVGMEFTNRGGCRLRVIKYESALSVTVKFLDTFGYETVAASSNIRKGAVKNKYKASVYGECYIGDGLYGYSDRDGVKTAEYVAWQGAARRCYCPIYHKNKPTYEKCTMSEDWKDFQIFGSWFVKQMGFDKGWHLDKDVLFKGNKLYSSETCCLLPPEINMLLTNIKTKDSDLPVGVARNGNLFNASVAKYGKVVSLGNYTTPEEAFYVYKEAKEEHIKHLVEGDYSYLPEHIKQALLNYRVEITD